MRRRADVEGEMLKDEVRTMLGHFKAEQEWEEARHKLYLRIARDVAPSCPLFGDPGPFVNHSFERLEKLNSIVEEITRVLDDLNSEVLSLEDLALQVVAEQFMAGSVSRSICLRPWQIVKLLEILPMTLIEDLFRWPVKSTKKTLETVGKVKQLMDWIKTNDHGPRRKP